jgi:hypothetical protein
MQSDIWSIVWRLALAEPVGIRIKVGDVKYAKAKLYATRPSDEWAICVPPEEEGTLWLVRKNAAGT